MALLEAEGLPIEGVSSPELMLVPPADAQGFTQDALAPELAERLWLTHEEVMDLFDWARAEADLIPDNENLVETRFLDEPDFRERTPVIGRFRPSEINTLEQVRRAYDIRRIQRIGESIAEDGQLQNCGIAYLNEKHARTYLTQANRFFGSDYKLADLSPDSNGRYAILIWGHNRDFGIRSANIEKNGHEDVGLGIEAKVYPNISFSDAIRKQFVENTGEQPPLHERAYAVRAYIDSVAEGNGHTPRQVLAKQLNMSVRQVDEAFAYLSLPEGVRALVERAEGGLPFSTAIQFASMEGVCSQEEIVHYAKRSMENGYSGKKVGKMVQEVVGVNRLPETVQALVQAGTLSFDRAALMRPLIGLLDDMGISSFALSATANNWDSERYNLELRRLYNNASYKQEGLFGQLIDQMDAQQAADKDFWRRQNDAAFALLVHGLDALEGYVSLNAISAGRDGALQSAVPAEKVQAILERCDRQLRKLETVDEAMFPEVLKQRYGSLRREVLARVGRVPTEESNDVSLF